MEWDREEPGREDGDMDLNDSFTDSTKCPTLGDTLRNQAIGEFERPLREPGLSGPLFFFCERNRDFASSVSGDHLLTLMDLGLEGTGGTLIERAGLSTFSKTGRFLSLISRTFFKIAACFAASMACSASCCSLGSMSSLC